MMYRAIASSGLKPIQWVLTVLAALPVMVIAAPNADSVAEIAACRESDATAFVCSSKELSNVVLQCTNGEGSTFFVKEDDLDEATLADPHAGSFSCPPGTTLDAVFVKSGSQKTAGTGAPFGGVGMEAIFSPELCADPPIVCPETGGEDEGEEPGGEGGTPLGGEIPQ